METRKITVYSSRNGVNHYDTDIRTFGELKNLIKDDYDLSGNISFIESLNKTSLIHDDSVLPAEEFTMFIRPNQIKAGANDNTVAMLASTMLTLSNELSNIARRVISLSTKIEYDVQGDELFTDEEITNNDTSVNEALEKEMEELSKGRSMNDEERNLENEMNRLFDEIDSYNNCSHNYDSDDDSDDDDSDDDSMMFF